MSGQYGCYRFVIKKKASVREQVSMGYGIFGKECDILSVSRVSSIQPNLKPAEFIW